MTGWIEEGRKMCTSALLKDDLKFYTISYGKRGASVPANVQPTPRMCTYTWRKITERERGKKKSPLIG